MTSSAPRPSRRIASNLLWTPQGLVRHPLLTLGADGRVLSAESCPDPDRLAATEFYAGLLVPDFPADYRAAFDGMRAAALPLSELLPRIVTPGGALVVISGLDYDSLRLTALYQEPELDLAAAVADPEVVRLPYPGRTYAVLLPEGETGRVRMGEQGRRPWERRPAIRFFDFRGYIGKCSSTVRRRCSRSRWV